MSGMVIGAIMGVLVACVAVVTLGAMVSLSADVSFLIGTAAGGVGVLVGAAVGDSIQHP